jgi:hypothetical protein
MWALALNDHSRQEKGEKTMNAGQQTLQWQAIAALIITQLTGAKLHLYTVSIPWAASNLLAVYTAAEATFTGYAAVTVSPVVATNQPSGGQLVWLLQAIFQLTGTPGATAYGWFLTDSTSAILYAAGQFDTPYEFVNDGDGFALQTALGIGNDQQIQQAFSTMTE